MSAAHDKQGYLDDRCLDEDIKFLKEPYNPFLPHSSSTQSVPELFERIFSIISNSSHSLISWVSLLLLRLCFLQTAEPCIHEHWLHSSQQPQFGKAHKPILERIISEGLKSFD